MIDTTHWFWWSITAFTLVWYSTITLYVTVRGATDIRDMLRRLQATNDDTRDESGPISRKTPGKLLPEIDKTDGDQ